MSVHANSLIFYPTSDAPRQASRRVSIYFALALSWLGLLLYGSLVPFDLQPLAQPIDGIASLLDAILRFLTAPRWFDAATLIRLDTLGNSNPYSDLWLNLVLYGPLGVLLRLDARRLGASFRHQLIGPVVFAFGISWLVECTQGLTVERVASLNDVLGNTLGAAAGAIAAVWLLTTVKRTLFAAYCRVAFILHVARVWLRRQRGSAGLTIAIAAANLLLALGWFAIQLNHGKLANGKPVNWLPFYLQFDTPYGQAIERLGTSFIVYLLLAMLLSLLAVSWRNRRLMGLMVLALASMAGVLELMRVFNGRRADVTEPLVAILAAGFLAFAINLVALAVRQSCRRKSASSVPIERRRVPHPDARQAHLDAPPPTT